MEHPPPYSVGPETARQVAPPPNAPQSGEREQAQEAGLCRDCPCCRQAIPKIETLEYTIKTLRTLREMDQELHERQMNQRKLELRERT